VFSLDLGFRSDSGLSGYTDDSDTLLQLYVNRTLLNIFINFIYLVIIKVIIEQVIAAIMVDKFASIRLKKDKL
jgi:hypothetical protein